MCECSSPRHRTGENDRCPDPPDTPHALPPPCRQHHSKEVSAEGAPTLNIERMRGIAVGSFKFKLVVYFLLLSLLPIAAAFWGFASVAGQSETRRVDARLQAGPRAVIASYQERLPRAPRGGARVAPPPHFPKQNAARGPPPPPPPPPN